VEVRRPKSEGRPAATARQRGEKKSETRTLGLGLWVSCVIIYVFTLIAALAAATNDGPELPSSSLRPPRGEISASFWEQYGLWVVLGAVLALGTFAALIWLLVRPRPPVPIPPAVQAREELEPLKQKPEEGFLLSDISQILRHYLAAVFPLPSGELTTTDLSRSIVQDQQIGPELGSEVIEFLRACDLRKFAPAPPATPLDAVS